MPTTSYRRNVVHIKSIRIGTNEKIEIMKTQSTKISFFTDSRWRLLPIRIV